MRRWTPRLGPSASEPLRTVLDQCADVQELIACIADPVTKAKPVLLTASGLRKAEAPFCPLFDADDEAGTT